MSNIEEIAHLDFPTLPMGSLRERAVRDFHVRLTAIVETLEGYATSKIAQILGNDVRPDGVIDVRVTNIRDGDGEATFAVEGVRFKVIVVFPVEADPSDPPKLVKLSVQVNNGWMPVDCLADLGRYLEQGGAL